MAHPDLVDEFMEIALNLHDEGKLFAFIHPESGLMYSYPEGNSQDDALPRRLMVIASVVQQYIESTGLARWEFRNGEDGVVLTCKETGREDWCPLADLGVNQEMGFYPISQWPVATNDAELR